MKQIDLGKSGMMGSSIVYGGSGLGRHSVDEGVALFHTVVESGINMFDNADIYGGGEAETRFGEVFTRSGIARDSILIQSKCAIRPENSPTFYDASYDHILRSVDNSLRRMRIDYLDTLLLHRPDALMEPEEVARAFDRLHSEGKVRHFGVSNHNSMQMALLQKHLGQKLIVNQLQFSLAHAGLVSVGLEVNTLLPASADRGGLVMDYCRLHDVTIQAWSPFRNLHFKVYIDNPDYEGLNAALRQMADAKGLTPTAIATAWMLRLPCNMQLVIGSGNPDRIREIARAVDITLSRAEWYALYQAAGYAVP